MGPSASDRGFEPPAPSPFDGSSFEVWRIAAAEYLEHHGFDAVVLRGETPESAGHATQARTALRSMLAPNVQEAVLRMTDAHEMWLYLVRTYGLDVHSFLVNEFNEFIARTRFVPGRDSPLEYATKWRCFQIRALDAGVDLGGPLGYGLFVARASAMPNYAPLMSVSAPATPTLEAAILPFERLGRDLRPVERHDRKKGAPKGTLLVSAIANTSRPRSTALIVDSGATCHVVSNESLFVSKKQCPLDDQGIELADGSQIPIKAYGTVVLDIRTSNGPGRLVLNDVAFVPSSPYNLLSVPALIASLGSVTLSARNGLLVHPSLPGEVKLHRTGRKTGFFILRTTGPGPKALVAYQRDSIVSWEEMHSRLGHARNDVVKRACAASNPPVKLVGEPVKFCEPCIVANHQAVAVHKECAHRATYAGERLHADLIGPFNPKGRHGESYLLVVIDAFTRYVRVSAVPTKEEDVITAQVLAHLRWFETQTGRKAREFRSDRGKEFANVVLRRALERAGISLQLTAPDSPHQNGLAERVNGTLMRVVRAWHIDSSVPAQFWPYASHMAAFVYNLRTHTNLQGRSPHEVLLGSAPSLVGLRRFGAVGYYGLRQPDGKLGARARRCVLLGYDGTANNYVVYDEAAGKTFTTRDVKWPTHAQHSTITVSAYDAMCNDAENSDMYDAMPHNDDGDTPAPGEDAAAVESLDIDAEFPKIGQSDSDDSDPEYHDTSSDDGESTPFSVPDSETDGVTVAPEIPGEDTTDTPASPQTNEEATSEGPGESDTESSTSSHDETFVPRSQRKRPFADDLHADDSEDASATRKRNRALLAVARRLPRPLSSRHTTVPSRDLRRAGLALLAKPSKETCSDTPSLSQAMRSPDKDMWLEAIQREFQNLLEMNAVSVVPIQEGMHVFDGLLRLKRKRAPDQTLLSYKARYTGRGDQQTHGVDYFESSSPVVDWATFLSVVTVVCARDMEFRRIDIANAYLHAPLDEKIYIKAPAVAEVCNPSTHCLRVHTSLYGFCQSGRNWYEHLKKCLQTLGWSTFASDKCAWKRKGPDGTEYLIVYVDDLGIATPSPSSMASAVSQIGELLKIGTDADADQYIGVRITRDRSQRKAWLDLEGMTRKLLEGSSRDVPTMHDTPLPAKWKGETSETAVPPDEVKRYQSIVGSLIYLSIRCRPDLSLAACLLGKHAHGPTKKCWKGIEHVLGYLARTASAKLSVSPGDLQLHAFSDADFDKNEPHSRNTSGYVIFLGDTPIKWTSRRQANVSISSRDSELQAATDAARDIAFVRSLARDLRLAPSSATPILIDNQPLLDNIESLGRPALGNHQLPRLNYLREQRSLMTIAPIHVPSADNAADAFTKALPRDLFVKHMSTIGMCLIPRESGGSVVN